MAFVSLHLKRSCETPELRCRRSRAGHLAAPAGVPCDTQGRERQIITSFNFIPLWSEEKVWNSWNVWQEVFVSPLAIRSPSASVTDWGLGSQPAGAPPCLWHGGEPVPGNSQGSLGLGSSLVCFRTDITWCYIKAVKIQCTLGQYGYITTFFLELFLLTGAGLKLDGFCVVLFGETDLIPWKMSVEDFSNCSILFLFWKQFSKTW